MLVAGPSISAGNACGLLEFGKAFMTFRKLWIQLVSGSRAAGLASGSLALAIRG